MEKGKMLRRFRINKEENKKTQTTMLRFVRTAKRENSLPQQTGNCEKGSNSMCESTSSIFENLSSVRISREKFSDSLSSTHDITNSLEKKQQKYGCENSEAFKISKPLFVNPLSQKELTEKAEQQLSGYDLNSVFKDANNINSNSSLPDDVSSSTKTQDVDSNFDEMPQRKKRRIVSDSESETDNVPRKNAVGSDDENENETNFLEGKSAEFIENLVDTYAGMYPDLEKMEIFDAFQKYNTKFSEFTKFLDLRSKVEKRKKKYEKVKTENCEENEEVNTPNDATKGDDEKKIKRQIKKEEKKQKKILWKMKARNVEDEFEEDEGEAYKTKFKVYESDSSDDEENERIEKNNTNRKFIEARDLTLKFFNEATVPELSCLSTCSKKKSLLIVGCRPFEDWKDLVFKIKNDRNLSTLLLNSAFSVIKMQTGIQSLMKKCEIIVKEIESSVTEILSGNNLCEMPKSLNPEMTLKNYQHIGLSWLQLMHSQDLNGILADEMGLGKTIQAIAFLAHLMERGELERERSLIVVPSSTLDNWARELETWCPELTFLVYHGSQEERRGMRTELLTGELEEEVYLILTTYNMVASVNEDRSMFKKLALHTIIFDEAHMLKNMTTQRYENLMKIQCKRRVLLTGTPLQNNLVELMSIMIVVMPQLFEGRKAELKKIFAMFPKTEDEENQSAYANERIKQAKRILAPFFLRRLKDDVLKELPTKTDLVVRVPMCLRQETMYKDTIKLINERAAQIKEELENMTLEDLSIEENDRRETRKRNPNQAGGSNQENSNQAQSYTYKTGSNRSTHYVMTLRKLANHPLLIRELYTDEKIREIAKILKRTSHRDSILEYIIDDLSVMSDFEIHKYCVGHGSISHFKLTSDDIVNSGKLKKFDELLPQMKINGNRVLIFSQFVMILDILQEYLKIRGYTYKRLDGSTQVNERQEMIDEYNENSNIFIFLLSTRAGGLGINLSSGNVVIIHDIDFNPYNDKQAEDRCHRMGQTREVTVYRLISGNSIEEGIYKIAMNKLKLEKDVTGRGENKGKIDTSTLLQTVLENDNVDSKTDDINDKTDDSRIGNDNSRTNADSEINDTDSQLNYSDTKNNVNDSDTKNYVNDNIKNNVSDSEIDDKRSILTDIDIKIDDISSKLIGSEVDDLKNEINISDIEINAGCENHGDSKVIIDSISNSVVNDENNHCKMDINSKESVVLNISNSVVNDEDNHSKMDIDSKESVGLDISNSKSDLIDKNIGINDSGENSKLNIHSKDSKSDDSSNMIDITVNINSDSKSNNAMNCNKEDETVNSNSDSTSSNAMNCGKDDESSNNKTIDINSDSDSNNSEMECGRDGNYSNMIDFKDEAIDNVIKDCKSIEFDSNSVSR